MKSNLLRAIYTLVLLACPLFPSTAQTEISTPPGSAERIAKMKTELRTLQEEAAKDPSRPTLADLRRDLDQMVAERNAAAARRHAGDLDGWLTRLSFGLNVALALTLLGVLIRRGGTRPGGRWRASSAE